MGIFKKRSAPQSSSSALPTSDAFMTADSLPEPSTDWTDLSNIVAEWEHQLEGEAGGLLGWRNGTRMFEEGVIPAQKGNVAEYITRGLAYHLFKPVLSDADALVAAKRVLVLVDEIPAEAAFWADFGPRLARLALAVIREKGWQPAALGGDDSITKEILAARHDGLVFYSARCPGVAVEDTWKNFFLAAK